MQHVPDYVYLILAVLVYIGIKRCFASVMRPERLLLFPALMLFNGYDSLPGLLPALNDSAMIAAGLTLAAGAYIGWQHAARWTLHFSADGKQVRVPAITACCSIFWSALPLNLCCTLRIPCMRAGCIRPAPPPLRWRSGACWWACRWAAASMCWFVVVRHRQMPLAWTVSTTLR